MADDSPGHGQGSLIVAGGADMLSSISMIELLTKSIDALLGLNGKEIRPMLRKEVAVIVWVTDATNLDCYPS